MSLQRSSHLGVLSGNETYSGCAEVDDQASGRMPRVKSSGRGNLYRTEPDGRNNNSDALECYRASGQLRSGGMSIEPMRSQRPNPIGGHSTYPSEGSTLQPLMRSTVV